MFSFMEKNGMVQPGDKVILGISGGADSVCLLFLLLEYKRKVPFELLAVHVNHGIRGAAADQDAAYVESLCREQGVIFRLESVDVGKLAKEEKCSVEDAGRRVRYRTFQKAARELGGAKIAVAHNAGDRAETMLLHLFRGSGLKGLRGIDPVREEIIRPLLCLERQEIEAYLEERGISWRTDSTNGEDCYTRNRIRRHFLSWAEREISGRAVEHMCRTADILSETEEYLRLQTEAALADCAVRRQDSTEVKLAGSLEELPAEVGGESGTEGRSRECRAAEVDVDRFLSCHPVLQKRMILALAEGLSPTGKDIQAVHIDEVLSLFQESGNRSVDLPFGIRFTRRYAKVAAERRAQDRKTRISPLQNELPKLEFTRLFVKKWENVPENRYTKWFDCAKIKKQPVLRFRQPRDYLTLSDGKGNIIRKSLKEYMIDAKIPREMRGEIPVLAEGSHVLWLIGYRSSEYYRAGRNTKCILQVKLEGDCAGSETEEKMRDRIRVLLTEEEVDRRIGEIGAQISRNYEGKSVHLVCVLKGGSFFMCELAKRITVPVSLDFMSVSSYGSDTKSSGVVKIVKDLDESLLGKDVLVVEDIVDSGRTLSYLLEMLRDRGPASLKLCTLLDKPDRRVIDVNVDYTGFQIPDEFVVGYGLDYNQMYRNLPYIGIVETDK